MANARRFQFHLPKKGRKRKRTLIIGSAALSAFTIFAFVQWVLPLLTSRESVVSPSTEDFAVLWNNGQYSDIIEKSEGIMAKNPLNSEALLFYGLAHYYKAYFEKALEDKIPLLDTAIIAIRRAKLSTDIPYPLEADYILGQAYYYKGKFFYDQSVKYIERLVEGGYTGGEAYEYLGLAYGGLGNTQKELESFLKAAQDNPSDQILLSTGLAYLKLNEAEQAEDYLLRALNKTTDNNIEKESRLRLAEIYIDRGEYLKAEEQYQIVTKVDPRSAEAHFQLGELYMKMNDSVRARAFWRKTLGIDPDHHGAKLRYYG
jgi:tetratricopeptide (TPR) repeat protein